MATQTFVAANCVTTSSGQNDSGSTVEYEECEQQPPATAVADGIVLPTLATHGTSGGPTVLGTGLGGENQSPTGPAESTATGAGQQTTESAVGSSATQPQGVVRGLFNSPSVSPIGTPGTTNHPVGNLPMSPQYMSDDVSHGLGQQGNAAVPGLGFVQASAGPGGSSCWNCVSGSLVLQHSQYMDMVECIGQVERQIIGLRNEHSLEVARLVQGHEHNLKEVNDRLSEEVALTSDYEQKLVALEHRLSQILESSREKELSTNRDVQAMLTNYQTLTVEYRTLEGALDSLRNQHAQTESRAIKHQDECDFLAKENAAMRVQIVSLTKQNEQYMLLVKQIDQNSLAEESRRRLLTAAQPNPPSSAAAVAVQPLNFQETHERIKKLLSASNSCLLYTSDAADE